MLPSSKWGGGVIGFQAKKIPNDPITKYDINNIHQIN